MRDILLFLLVLGLLPLCIMRPYFGVLAWSWLGYMNPQKLTWGFAFNFPFVQLVAIATLSGLIYLFAHRESRPELPWSTQTMALLLLWFFYTLSAVFALNTDLSWPAWGQMSKTMVLIFVTLLLIDNSRKLRYLILVITLSIAFYGFKGGLFAIANGGKYMVMGPGGLIGDNNNIGLALNMVLPSVYYLSIFEQNKFFRLALKATFFLSILAIVFTYSRGAMLGLVAVLFLILLRSKLSYKIITLMCVVIALPFIVEKVPESWYEKMGSIQSIETDGSAMNRFRAWETSWNLAKDRPITGGGFNALHDVKIYDTYHSGKVYEGIRVNKTGAHSIYFEIIGENGLIAFALFMFLILSTIYGARKSHREHIKDRPDGLPDYGPMIGIGVIAYAISGAFLEQAGFDLFYHLVAIMIIIRHLQRKAVTSQ